nr:MAG TPA: hypothetical protein [Caudoviricetes sp.]
MAIPHQVLINVWRYFHYSTFWGTVKSLLR